MRAGAPRWRSARACRRRLQLIEVPPDLCPAERQLAIGHSRRLFGFARGRPAGRRRIPPGTDLGPASVRSAHGHRRPPKGLLPVQGRSSRRKPTAGRSWPRRVAGSSTGTIVSSASSFAEPRNSISTSRESARSLLDHTHLVVVVVARKALPAPTCRSSLHRLRRAHRTPEAPAQSRRSAMLQAATRIRRTAPSHADGPPCSDAWLQPPLPSPGSSFGRPARRPWNALRIVVPSSTTSTGSGAINAKPGARSSEDSAPACWHQTDSR